MHPRHQAGYDRAHGAQADRAGQGRSHHRTVVGVGRHRDARLRKTIPDKVVINGISGALETTWVDPRRTSIASISMAASGASASVPMPSRPRATSASPRSSPTIPSAIQNFMGFAVDYCKAGGDIAQRSGSHSASPISAASSRSCPRTWMQSISASAAHGCDQLPQPVSAGRRENTPDRRHHPRRPDRADRARSCEGRAEGHAGLRTLRERQSGSGLDLLCEALSGQLAAAQRLPSPSLFGLGYYTATLAAIKGLEAAGGDLSNGQAKFKEALNKLQLDSPVGRITLNENRQATGTVFINEVSMGRMAT